MASSYTALGVELMVTGENAGTWGTKTNTNLQLFEQIAGGYLVQTLNATGTGVTTTALDVDDGALTGTACNRVIILGAESAQAIGGNKTVTVPNDVENWYLVKNSTSGAYTVNFKYATGTGDSVTWATTDKGWKMIYATKNDGTNPDIGEIALSTDPGGSTTQIQYNNSGAFGGDANLIWDSSTGLNIGTSKELRLQDDSGAEYVGMKASNGTTDYTMTWPAGVAAGNDYVLKSTTGGVLSWGELTGGTAWAAVKVTGDSPVSAAAGAGYFLNTTSGAITLTLPGSPTIGDEVSFVDYAGTFDSNALTIGRNGKKINGATADLTVSTERAANTLVYTDTTQGWLLKNK